jgi:Flp pilus assembly protein TadG
VEAALVISLCFLLLFGIFQYCRILMIRQVCENAARDAARYAVVHTYDKTTADIQNYARARLGGQEQHLANFTIQVYRADPATGANLGPWTDAGFNQCIAVQIDGDYSLPLPSIDLNNIVNMTNTTIHIRGRSTMYSEAN